MSKIEQLPTEVLLDIFACAAPAWSTEHQRHLLTLSRVSKRFHGPARYLLYQQLRPSNIPMIEAYLDARTEKQQPVLRSVSLYGYTVLKWSREPEVFARLFSTVGAGLRELHLAYIEGVPANVYDNLDQLREATIGCDFVTEENKTPLPSTRSLQKLTILPIEDKTNSETILSALVNTTLHSHSAPFRSLSLTDSPELATICAPLITSALRELNLARGDDCCDSWPSLPLHNASALRHLTIDPLPMWNTASSLRRILSQLSGGGARSAPLETLKCVVDGHWRPAILEALLEEGSRQPVLANLRALEVKFVGWGEEVDPEEVEWAQEEAHRRGINLKLEM